MRFDSCWRNDF